MEGTRTAKIPTVLVGYLEDRTADTMLYMFAEDTDEQEILNELWRDYLRPDGDERQEPPEPLTWDSFGAQTHHTIWHFYETRHVEVKTGS